MKHFRRLAVCLFCSSVMYSAPALAEEFKLSRDELMNKIKGAWAAQTIGVTYGFPVEFRFQSALVPESFPVPWDENSLKNTYEYSPGAYDDIYMDLSFVQVIEDEGVDAPVQSFADAFANAKYPLWFANQMARYNVLNGLTPPASGHWLNNPAADDIDFQIEADFIGIMSPGMINTATQLSDKIGHIMNYGDGWYGGVFVAAMYSQAFITADISEIIDTALSTIPPESQFHQTILDVVKLHDDNPEDWKHAWFEIHKKWSDTDLGPAGAHSPFNIDAKINAAWVVLGLLYGDGDFAKTIEIATRAGDDADCNPATAAGILGTIYGYDAIPTYWMQGLSDVEDTQFAHTEISLNDAYRMSFDHAVDVIESGGGAVTGEKVTIKIQDPKVVPLEVSFDGHYLKERRNLSYYTAVIPFLTVDGTRVEGSYQFDFNGNGFAVMGYAKDDTENQHEFKAELYVDGELVETASLPSDFDVRRFYLFWKYQLAAGDHQVEIKLLNPSEGASVYLTDIITYDEKPKERITLH
ncbi:ADP-ribosylglycohydrolase family protein [Hyphococcus lacteus]|uniref:ADP-ribosylglycohydrolase family protein n=1 Tax=Hyphococcus lacteus TaxID=3143536 RepID=A0ABV3Z6S9_9PROT